MDAYRILGKYCEFIHKEKLNINSLKKWADFILNYKNEFIF